VTRHKRNTLRKKNTRQRVKYRGGGCKYKEMLARCTNCDGGRNRPKCSHCGGSGQKLGQGRGADDSCNQCRGTGKSLTCPVCTGGLVQSGYECVDVEGTENDRQCVEQQGFCNKRSLS